MADRSDLLALALRIESAGASRSASCEIARAVGWVHRENISNDFKWLGPDGLAYLTPPHFTASVDAAKTLEREAGRIAYDREVAADLRRGF